MRWTLTDKEILAYRDIIEGFLRNPTATVLTKTEIVETTPPGSTYRTFAPGRGKTVIIEIHGGSKDEQTEIP